MKDTLFVKCRPGFVISGFKVDGKMFPKLTVVRNGLGVSFGSLRRLAEFCSVVRKAVDDPLPIILALSEHFGVFDCGETVELSIDFLGDGFLIVAMTREEFSHLCDLAMDIRTTMFCS